MPLTMAQPGDDVKVARRAKVFPAALFETTVGAGSAHIVLADRNPVRGERLVAEFTNRGASVSVFADPFALPAALNAGLAFHPTLLLVHVDEFVTSTLEQAVTLAHVTDVALGALGSRSAWDVPIGVISGKPLTHAEVLRAIRAGATHAWSWAGQDLEGKFRDIMQVSTPNVTHPRPRNLSATVRTPNGEVALTGRERQLLFGASRGLSKHDIASRLLITEATVKSLMQRLYGRLDVQGITEAVAVAYHEGILR